MRYIITGCAGFIGSKLTQRLLEHNHEIVGMDNFSTGLKEFIQPFFNYPHFKFKEIDLCNQPSIIHLFEKVDAVFHLAANADVRSGLNHPHKDFQQNTLATFNVLEAMRYHQIQNIIFASTGSVYGEATQIPTPENAAFPIQTSLYGASKLAAEGLIQAYCEGFGMKAYIFRFVSILGEHYTHGHVFDFYKQILSNPLELKVLGNGKQKKSYLYIEDCIDAILLLLQKAKEKINIFNLGTDEYCEVNDSIQWICDYLKVQPRKTYSGEERGWIGDNPFIYLDCSKAKKFGWHPKLNIKDSVLKTVKFLQGNPWVLAKR